MSECRTCESFRGYLIHSSPHIGSCYREGKWRKWISKPDYRGPVDCPHYQFKPEYPAASFKPDTIEELFSMQQVIMDHVPGGDTPEAMAHQITCGLGIIEETMEYLNSIGRKPWRPVPLPPEKQLEELVDILHFYLELILRSPFDWGDLVIEYKRKHAINLQRYEAGSRGDFSWDDKGMKGEL